MAEEKAENWRKVAVLKRESGAITTKLLSSDQERSANHALANARQDFELPRQGHQLYIYIYNTPTQRNFLITLYLRGWPRESIYVTV